MVQDVIDSLDTLRTGTIKANFEFQGLAKSLTQAADSTSKAGKGWTTFSRLVSGTPLWATQNKIRAYLSILGGFETRSKANTEAHDREAKALLAKIKGYDKVNEQMKEVYANSKNLIKYGVEDKKLTAQLTAEKKKAEAQNLKNLTLAQSYNDDLLRVNVTTGKTTISTKMHAKLMKTLNTETEANNKTILKHSKRLADVAKITSEVSDATKEALTSSAAYQKVFLATGDEEKAMNRSIKFFHERNKLLDEERLALKKNAKIAFAFDNNRVKEAKKLARVKADEKGKGFFGKKMASFTGGVKERFSQKKDQLGAGKAVKRDAGRANAKGVTTNLKNAKMLLAPLLLVTKSTKLLHAGFNPFSKDAIKFRLKMRKFTMSLQPIMSMIFKYLVMSMLAIAGIFLIIVFLKRYFEILKEFGVIDEIKQLGLMVFDFLKIGWKMVSAFINGDYEKALDYASKFVDKGIIILIKTGKLLAKMAFLALVTGFDLLISAVYKFYKDPAFRKQVMGILMKVALVVVALIVIQFLIGVALSIAAAFALPVLIGVAVLAALFSVAYWLDNTFDEKFQHVEDYINNFLAGIQHYFDTVKNDIINFFIKAKEDIIFGFTEAFKELKSFFNIEARKEAALASLRATGTKLIGLVTSVRDYLNPVKKVRGGYNKIKDSIVNSGVFGSIKGKFAKGGTSHGGLSLVGEQGPELLNLSAGSQVYSNSQSKKMVGGNTNVFNITINAKDTSDAEMRRVAEQLGKMIGNKINRRIPFGNLI